MKQELYWKMYVLLCGAVSDASDALQDPHNGLHARIILETAILKAEDMYLTATDEDAVTQ